MIYFEILAKPTSYSVWHVTWKDIRCFTCIYSLSSQIKANMYDSCLRRELSGLWTVAWDLDLTWTHRDCGNLLECVCVCARARANDMLKFVIIFRGLEGDGHFLNYIFISSKGKHSIDLINVIVVNILWHKNHIHNSKTDVMSISLIIQPQ